MLELQNLKPPPQFFQRGVSSSLLSSTWGLQAPNFFNVGVKPLSSFNVGPGPLDTELDTALTTL